MMTYRVRALRDLIMHYHGYSFEHASLIFDQAQGSRVLERRVDGEWRDVVSIRLWGED